MANKDREYADAIHAAQLLATALRAIATRECSGGDGDVYKIARLVNKSFTVEALIRRMELGHM